MTGLLLRLAARCLRAFEGRARQMLLRDQLGDESAGTACCGALSTVGGDPHEGTMYAICSACGRPATPPVSARGAHEDAKVCRCGPLGSWASSRDPSDPCIWCGGYRVTSWS